MARLNSTQIIAQIRERRRSKPAYDLGDTKGVYARGNILMSENKVLKSLTPSKHSKRTVRNFLKHC